MLACKHDRDAKRNTGCQGRSDAARLDGQNLVRLERPELTGKFLPGIAHEQRVELVVDERVHCEDAAPQVLAFPPDALSQLLHSVSPFVCDDSARGLYACLQFYSTALIIQVAGYKVQVACITHHVSRTMYEI